MKKFIFLLTIAFLSCSLALNAQNSSKLSYNTDGSPILSEELKTKLKAKGISEADYLQEFAETKQKQQPAQPQVKATQPKAKTKTIDKPQLKIKQPAKQFKTAEKSVISQTQEDLKAKGRQMNLDFAKKGLPYKTRIKTVNGKHYIQIVDLPLQNGQSPIKSKQ